MRKIAITLLLLASITGYGQTINNVFKTMPSDLLPGVSEGNKTMLLVDTGKTVVPYALGEVKKMQHGNDYLELRTSDVGTTQIKLLPISSDSMIVCVVKTVCEKPCDSHIAFYTTDWEKLESSVYLPKISVENFFDSSQKDTENYKYAVSLPDIYAISAEFNRDNTDIKLIFNYKSYLSEEIIAEMKPFLKTDSMVLAWNNQSFR